MRFYLYGLPILLLIAGCGAGGFSTRASAGKENTLRVALATTPVTFDPGKAQDVDTHDLLRQVFEGLVRFDANDQIVPGLAEQWEISEDGLTYTFILREATFHNGRRVTADDVKWTLTRNLRPELGSPTAQTYLSDIVGAVDVAAGRSDELSGVVVIDDTTVQIRVEEPRPYLLGKLTYLPAYILPREVGDSEITRIDQMIGTGPFMPERYESEQLFTMVPYSDYYGDLPSIERIERPIIKDSATRMNKFKSGELDWVTIERQEIPSFQNDPVYRDQIRYIDRPATVYVGLNPGGYAPFENREIRRAFAMAVDREYLVREVLRGAVEPAYGILPPAVPGHRARPTGPSYNPDEARRLLAQAGYPDPSRLPPLLVTIREGNPDARIVGEAVITQWSEHLGVRVNLQTMEWKTMLERRNDGELGSYVMSWYADYLDPQNFLSLLFTGYSPHNTLNYRNPEVDRLCATADAFAGPMPDRLRLYAQAEDIILQDAPWVPLYYVRDAVLVNPRVENLQFNIYGALPANHLRLTTAP